ncbi:hypothetical protein [Streptomyces niveus]|uniref:hypothetical protein n=1 Tax=Streptomyces niveus TaxID=193462 RepID=UPI00343EB42F
MSDRTTDAGSPVEEAAAPANPALDPAPAPGTAPAPEPAAPRRRTAALRWTAAVVVFGALGTTVAYAVTEQERTDIPTLATKNDGRWTYPTLEKPALPAGASGPFAPGNAGRIHYADLERLLLPAPEGSRPDPTLDGKNSRVPVSRFLQEYEKSVRPTMAVHLGDNGLRHIAARGWTMPDDGTATRVYLLRFHSMATAQDFFGTYLQGTTDASQKVTDVERLSSGDKAFPYGGAAGTESYAYDEVAPRGPVHVRHAYISAGDTLALIIQSRKGSAPRVPFDQTVILQNQLLG